MKDKIWDIIQKRGFPPTEITEEIMKVVKDEVEKAKRDAVDDYILREKCRRENNITCRRCGRVMYWHNGFWHCHCGNQV